MNVLTQIIIIPILVCFLFFILRKAKKIKENNDRVFNDYINKCIIIMLLLLSNTVRSQDVMIGCYAGTAKFITNIQINDLVGIGPVFSHGNANITDVSMKITQVGAIMSFAPYPEYGKIMLGSSYIKYDCTEDNNLFFSPEKLRNFSVDIGAMVYIDKSDICSFYISNDWSNWILTLGVGINIINLYKFIYK